MGGSYHPFAVWNKKNNNIMYVRSDGYEINQEGVIIRRYDIVNEGIYKKCIVTLKGKTYELQNRTHLPDFSAKKNKTYSTLVMIDENGTETVLCNSIRKQAIGQVLELLLLAGAIGIVIGIIVRKRREANLHYMRYGNIQIAELYKRVKVKKRPIKVKMKCNRD